MIQRIELEGVVPHVFTEGCPCSEVWLQSLTLERGRLYLIEASSGAGKSSLCSFIYGHRSDYMGRIAFDGQDIRAIQPERWSQIRRESLGLLFQELKLFDNLSVWENIQIKNQLTQQHSPEKIVHLLTRLGIGDKIDQPTGKLSLGQQQRVALIRMLMQPLDFIMLDEPISHLDDANASTVAEIILAEAQRQGAAIICTSVGKALPLPYHHIYHL
ncbi:MAG: ATP-binding cassette domain-containing protein [Porphyromonadaceae bacterium]|nr:ATP-binding cassette domain-containing protein [Porphyromonadaceae bacterium]